MAVRPTPTDTFAREVDEELRRDDAARLWKRWGRWLIGGILGALTLFAGFLWWQNAHQDAAGVDGEKLSVAIDDAAAGNTTKAKPALTALTSASKPGVRAAAKLALAGSAMAANDLKSASAQYKAIADDTGFDAPYRDLALLRQTELDYDSLPPQTVIDRLKPLAVPGNPWFGSAGELVGSAYLKLGKTDLAAALLNAVVKDKTVPDAIRGRVGQLALTLGAPVIEKGKN